MRTISEELGIGFYGVGFRPDAPREAIPWMPKGRYAIMRRYMPTRGSLGLDMMTRTCTVQVNLDFDSETDMVRKLRVAMALQPVATALFANSPFVEGKPSGFRSYRSHVWTDTDPDRCGLLAFVFEPGMGFERYADYVLDAPMYFVARDGGYIDVAGESFRDFLRGALPQLPGERPTLKDWEDHLTTVFPEVRLKTFIEMRGADSGPWGKVCALPALWVGLLYDSTALNEAEALVASWTAADVAACSVPCRGRRSVPRSADGRCRRWPATRWRSLPAVSCGALSPAISTPTSAPTSPICGRSRRAGGPPPTTCSRPTRAAGAAASNRSSRNTPISAKVTSGNSKAPHVGVAYRLNPALHAVIPPPIAEIAALTRGRVFPPEKPLLDLAQAVPATRRPTPSPPISRARCGNRRWRATPRSSS